MKMKHWQFLNLLNMISLQRTAAAFLIYSTVVMPVQSSQLDRLAGWMKSSNTSGFFIHSLLLFWYMPQTSAAAQLNTIFQRDLAVSSPFCLVLPDCRVSVYQTLCCMYVDVDTKEQIWQRHCKTAPLWTESTNYASVGRSTYCLSLEILLSFFFWLSLHPSTTKKHHFSLQGK